MPTTAPTPNPAITADATTPGTDQAFEPPAPPPTPPHLTCDACSAPAEQDDLVVTLAGARICPACRRARYWQCEDCGGWNPDGYTCGNYCDDTADEVDDDTDDDGDDEPDGELVQDYGYKPYPVFHGTGPLFLGLELEVATPRGRWAPARLAVQHLDGLGYLKADESIGGGFEIVTHPMTYPWARHHFPWTLLPALTAAGCQATDRCGLHILMFALELVSPFRPYVGRRGCLISRE